MTPEKYKALINATGGFTKDVKRGDHPQPLSKEDEAALSRAWKTVRGSREMTSKRNLEESEKSTRVKF